METDQQEAAAATAPAPTPAAPQEVEEIIKKKRTKKSNVNVTSHTAGMQTEQLQVGCGLACKVSSCSATKLNLL